VKKAEEQKIAEEVSNEISDLGEFYGDLHDSMSIKTPST